MLVNKCYCKKAEKYNIYFDCISIQVVGKSIMQKIRKHSPSEGWTSLYGKYKIDNQKDQYDALTRPEAIKDFYENDQLVSLTKELTETFRKNKTIDWEKRDDARAKMRMMVKKLLKRYKYPPEGMDDAVQTVLAQCELWTDNTISA